MMNTMAIHIASLLPVFSQTAKLKMHPYPEFMLKDIPGGYQELALTENAPKLYMLTIMPSRDAFCPILSTWSALVITGGRGPFFRG